MQVEKSFDPTRGNSTMANSAYKKNFFLKT